MDVNVIPQNGKLFPFDDEDLDKLNKLKSHLVYRVTIKQDRNYKFHKKFFALLKKGYENTKLENISFDAYRDYITMKSGSYEIIELPDTKIAVAKSIAFDKMNQEEFEQLYNKALSVIAIDIQADREVLERKLLGFF